MPDPTPAPQGTPTISDEGLAGLRQYCDPMDPGIGYRAVCLDDAIALIARLDAAESALAAALADRDRLAEALEQLTRVHNGSTARVLAFKALATPQAPTEGDE